MSEMFKDYTNLLDESEQHLSNESLAVYVNLKEQLSLKEKDFIERHVNKCELCKNKLNEIIEEDIEIDPGKVKDSKFYTIPKFIKYAAAASIFIAIGIAYYFISISKEENKLAVNSTINEKTIDEKAIDTLKNAEKVEDMEMDKKIEQELNNKDLYAVNAVLENFIERNLRSDSKLRILEPKINEVVRTPIEFKWKRYNYSGNVELEILNNKNKKFISKETNGISIKITEKLPKGLYYWKIKANGKIEDIGKFKIM